MKKFVMMAVVSLLGSSSFAGEPLMPELAQESIKNPILVCEFEDKDIDISAIAIDAKGNMSATINEKYASESPTPYLLYRGVEVLVSTKYVSVKGTFMTMAGGLDVAAKIPRKTKNAPVSLAGLAALCSAK